MVEGIICIDEIGLAIARIDIIDFLLYIFSLLFGIYDLKKSLILSELIQKLEQNFIMLQKILNF
jgi:phosphatidylglycerophosphatase A